VFKTASPVFRNIFKKQVTEDSCLHKFTKIQFHIPAPYANVSVLMCHES